MGEIEDKPRALEYVRVLDLTGEMGAYCAKILVGLGADVIKVEPPGGDSTRRLGPFFQNEPHPEKSLFFLHFSGGKRSITLNLNESDGRQIFRRLVRTADILVEDFPCGCMEGLGLGYASLRKVNPRLVFASITGFGREGPFRDYAAPDLVGAAMGGVMYLAGFAEDPPVRMGASQAFHTVSLRASNAIMLALYHQQLTGEGQQIDISMQEAVCMARQYATEYYTAAGLRVVRGGVIVSTAPGMGLHKPGMQRIYQCLDGMVICDGRQWEPWVEWLEAEGLLEDLGDDKWKDEALRVQEMEHVEAALRKLFLKLTRLEAAEIGQSRDIFVIPINSVADILADPHLRQRGFFVDVEYPELGAALPHVGPPCRLSETPWRVGLRAPSVGEHNAEILGGELGFSDQELCLLRTAGVI